MESNKIANFAYVDKCREVVSLYLTSIREHADGAKKIEANFKGDKLKEKMAEHRATEPSKQRFVDSIRNFTDSYLNYLNGLDDKAFDANNLTPDFQWLTVPAVLTAEELQKLRDRNADNPIFCRALRRYAEQHETDLGVSLDLSDGITARRHIIEGFTKDLIDTIDKANYEGFAFQNMINYFEQIDERLKGNGLFAQPEILVPEKDELDQGVAAATESVAFTQAFSVE